ncbi:MAG: NTP transferase domain-containing protein [Oligoflexales bacterium]
MQHPGQIGALVLAAGRGSRMQSNIPKVLHKVQDKTMLEHVLHSLEKACIQDKTLVLSQNLEPFHPILTSHPNLRACTQKNPMGTGHAVASAAAAYHHLAPAPYAVTQLVKGTPSNADFVLICTGDTPALKAETISTFLDACQTKKTDFAVLGMDTPSPFGYGRLVMRDDSVLKIVEERDANEQEKSITFCNTGVLFANIKILSSLLTKLRPQNAQNEYYLTDCVHHAQLQGISVYGHITPQWQDFLGVNTAEELAHITSYMEKRSCAEL